MVPTDGSAHNIRLLREAPGVKFAIVQADVYQTFVDRAGANREAARIIAPLRVILPLYNTEIHYIARADSPLNYLHDRAPDGFADIDAVISREELDAAAAQYKRIAGFDRDALNARPSLSVAAA